MPKKKLCSLRHFSFSFSEPAFVSSPAVRQGTFNYQLSKNETKRSCRFLWCKHPHYGWHQATEVGVHRGSAGRTSCLHMCRFPLYGGKRSSAGDPQLALQVALQVGPVFSTFSSGLDIFMVTSGLAVICGAFFVRGFLLRVSMNAAQVSPNDVSGHGLTVPPLLLLEPENRSPRGLGEQPRQPKFDS